MAESAALWPFHCQTPATRRVPVIQPCEATPRRMRVRTVSSGERGERLRMHHRTCATEQSTSPWPWLDIAPSRPLRSGGGEAPFGGSKSSRRGFVNGNGELALYAASRQLPDRLRGML